MMLDERYIKAAARLMKLSGFEGSELNAFSIWREANSSPVRVIEEDFEVMFDKGSNYIDNIIRKAGERLVSDFSVFSQEQEKLMSLDLIDTANGPRVRVSIKAPGEPSPLVEEIPPGQFHIEITEERVAFSRLEPSLYRE